MFLFSSLSPIILFVLIIVLINLNGKVNRLQSDIEKMRGGIPKVPQPQMYTPAALASISQQVPPQNTLSPAFPISSSIPSITSRKTDEENSGRWLGKIGILAILFGVSFFLKYAFDNNIIGETGRVILGILGGIVLVGLGQYFHKKYFTYAQILQGGGVGIFYLTIYAAFAYYGMIGQIPAFFLMALVTAFSVVLSIFSDTIHLAILGVAGGFLTPILISTGQNNLVGLFSYILLLDLGILAVSYFKKWIKLNYLGFVGTVLLFVGWFSRFYFVEELGQTFFFLSLFFLVYLFVSVLHHLVRKEPSEEFDIFLITANAGLYFGGSYMILNSQYHAVLGFFAVVLAFVYFLLAYAGRMAAPQNKLLNLYLPGIAVVFLSLAIPIQISGYWITVAWFIEALVLFLVSGSANVSSVRALAAVVYTVALIRYFFLDWSFGGGRQDDIIFFNHRFMTLVLAVAVSYVISYFYNKLVQTEPQNALEHKKTAGVFIVIATLLTIFLGTSEIDLYYAKQETSLQMSVRAELDARKQYVGQDYFSDPTYQNINAQFNQNIQSSRNEEHIAISIFWAIYAIILIAGGLYASSRILRILGVLFFFVTAIKVFVDIWNLGPLYRIISSIAFGVIALLASFLFVKYKDKI